MTRETKIGLLVGLAFIIVIGILLSDHFRTTMEPTQAALVNAANDVREAMSSPGNSNPPITIVAPQDAAPKQSIPTKEEVNPPVIASQPKPLVNNTGPVQQIPAGGFEADGPGAGSQELANIARRNGMEIVPENAVPTPVNGGMATPPPAALKSYTAQAGDSVSHMAAKFMGADNRANRQAIINANSSLQDDPDLVVVGQVYMIPTSAGAAAATVQNPAVTVATPTPPQQSQSSPFVYTVQEGDSLWRIANDQLGDAGAVEAIKSLNLSVLKGPNHDILSVGTKLRLPSKPIASAN